MTYRTRRSTFLQQLNRIARRAHRWAMVSQPQPKQHTAITIHTGRAY